MDTEKEFMAYMSLKENLYLYGAGTIARQILYLCENQGINVHGLIVTERRDNPEKIGNKRVWLLEEMKGEGMDIATLDIVVAISGNISRQVDEFYNLGCRSILFLSPKLKTNLRAAQLRDKFQESQDIYELDIHYPKAEVMQGVVVERVTGLPVFRVPQERGMKALAPLLEFGKRKVWEEAYGKIERLPHGWTNGIHGEGKGKIEVYVATTHMDQSRCEEVRDRGYIPIQVGAALTDIRKGCLTDHTGIHISEKNWDYCECTGLYWIWKNTKGQEYVGLCHYRRQLMLDDSSLRFLQSHPMDVVMALPQFEDVTVKEFFLNCVSGQDWKLLKQMVMEFEEGYKACFERYENGHFYFPCNIGLWKRAWFDRYCEFAFSIAEKVEEFYVQKGIVRHDRYMGYLFENLASLFVMRHWDEMRVGYVEIEWVQ